MKRLNMKPTSFGLTGNERGKEGMLKVMGKAGLLLEIAGSYNRDVDVVCVAVRSDWRALQYASTELRSRPEVVLEAVKRNGLALQFADRAVASDGDIVHRAVSHKGDALEFASEELKKHKEIVM